MAHELPPDLTTGSVAVDVGDGVGALLILTDASCVGEEIEVSPGAGSRRTHVAVLTRRVGARIAHAAVFPALPSGDYTVFRGDGRAAGRVQIPEAAVVELDWRGQ